MKKKNKVYQSHKSPYLHKTKIALLFAIPLLLGCLVLILHPSSLSVLGTSTEGVNTIVTVNTSHIITPVPSRFEGLSFETNNICDIIAWANQGNTFTQLLENLGSSVARIGGNSADHALWDPNGIYTCTATKTVITQQAIDDLFSIMSKANWKIIWTLNLGTYAPTTFSKEADYVIREGGSNLYALGIGNEPELYTQSGLRALGYDTSKYLWEWDVYKKAVLALHPLANLMGNDGCCSASWYTTFISNESSSLTLLTQHFYPTSKTSTDPERTPTIQNLLSASLMSQTASALDTFVQQATIHHLPLAIDETNSTNGGGEPGVSDTMASALWAVDYSFTALEHGVNHINFHTGISPSLYSPFTKNLTSMPLYYGMLLFHYAAPDGNVVATSTTSPYNITSHAIIADGNLRVTVINKDLSNNAQTEIDTPTAYASVHALMLTALSVTATTGITFGGSSIASNGIWNPTTYTSLSTCEN
ncbi:MAG TPA: glycosyl hydrolase family 79 C-terminal domain-containing protein, partial [Candidatus Saccharimonadales bacterium]|nr:glycosyl hydrolase family 79 C-terminal domain-containing protein [Candidatus Saccharimonadales bacterium]